MARSFLEDKDICIVAYGETKIERRSGRSAYEIAAEVAEQLYKKTKLGPSDIDGVTFTVPLSECSNPFWSGYATEYLGIPRSGCRPAISAGHPPSATSPVPPWPSNPGCARPQ